MFQKLIFKITFVIFSAVFLFVSTASAQDTVVNIVEWPIASGGNGHSYGIIPIEMPWINHKDLAETQTLNGDVGYLATITSAEENQFIVVNILSSMPNPPTINSQFYLGGQEFNNGDWMWHTGEEFIYTNWTSGEPNNVGIDAAVGIWGASDPIVGQWNDSPSDTAGHGSIHQLYSIIEFGVPVGGTGKVSLDNVLGSPTPGEIYAETAVKFQIRMNNNTTTTFNEIQNSFVIYSPDGASWTTTVGDTIGTIGAALFDLASVINLFGVTGSGADSIMFGGASLVTDGLVSGLNEVAYEITIGPIDIVDVGKTICLDSTFTPPNSFWIWSNPGVQPIHPSWDGPHCFTIVEPPSPVDTIVHLSQWTTASGGNDHYYGIVALEKPWNEHKSLAESLTLGGDFGYLATITSAEENQFIFDNLLTAIPYPPTINSQFYLGGQEFNNGNWMWHTGEQFNYTNWAPNEPNNVGIDAVVGIWGSPFAVIGGTWNDSPPDTINFGPINKLYAIIEFGAITIVPDSGALTLDHVVGSPAPGEIYAESDISFKIRLNNNTGLDIYQGFINSFRISSPDGATWTQTTGDTIGTIGMSMFDLVFSINSFSTDGVGADTIMFGGAALSASGIPAGLNEVAFEVNIGPIPSTDVGKTICIDSTWSPPSGDWIWVVNSSSDFFPSWDGPHCFTVVSAPPPAGGIISLVNVIGSPNPGEIYSETEVGFQLRLQNNTSGVVDGLTNSFVVYSPDGASWQPIIGDTIGTVNAEMFNLIFSINYFSATGFGADSILFGGASVNSPGMPPGFDEISYQVDIGVINASDTGKTICLDSTFTPPSGGWLWEIDASSKAPDWDGPHCFTIVAPPVPVDTLINVVQWQKANGGNDHWYGIISLVQNWDNHAATAATLDVGGEPGYLLSVTSAEENQFIVDNILAGNTNQPSVADEFYIGGMYLTEGLTWIWTHTTLPFGYTNWSTGEPSGDGFVVAMWGASTEKSGTWNDVPRNTENNTFNRLWAIVEFGEDAPATFDDSLVIPSVTAVNGENLQVVTAKVFQPIKGATIPIKIPEGVKILDVSTKGYVTENWDFNIVQVKPDSGFIFVVLANSSGETLPIGVKIGLFAITFAGNNPDCDQSLTVRWDTTLSDDVSRHLAFADVNAATVLVGFDVNRDSVLIPELLPGDFTNDGLLDISDLVRLISFMFLGGDAPVNMNSVDINGDCIGPDIGDMVRLIDFMFQGGAELPCGCLTALQKPDVNYQNNISIDLKYIDSKSYISISSSIDLMGIELIIRNESSSQPEKIYSEKLELIHHNANNITKLGIVDLKGNNAILSGETMLLSFDGEIEIISAVVADRESKSITPMINNKITVLPNEYKLFQNYPNPFNPTTQISFWLPEAGSVSLTVYNISGQKVATLIDGYKEAGEYTVEWNGSRQSSGIYLYRLESNQFSRTNKMILIK